MSYCIESIKNSGNTNYVSISLIIMEVKTILDIYILKVMEKPISGLPNPNLLMLRRE